MKAHPVDERRVSDLYARCMSDRLRELTAFVRAAETGSFSRVARELGVSQPSVSRMVAGLEARLDVKLLLRTTRRVAPTDAGRVFLERARQILGDLDDAEKCSTRSGQPARYVARCRGHSEFVKLFPVCLASWSSIRNWASNC
jgi:DNA-binding transcriptional LysR family regulator